VEGLTSKIAFRAVGLGNTKRVEWTGPVIEIPLPFHLCHRKGKLIGGMHFLLKFRLLTLCMNAERQSQAGNGNKLSIELLIYNHSPNHDGI
jgi:hypothetical protein